VHRLDGADDEDIAFHLLFFIQSRFLMPGNGFQPKITVSNTILIKLTHRLSWFVISFRLNKYNNNKLSPRGYKLPSMGYKLSPMGYKLPSMGYKLPPMGYNVQRVEGRCLICHQAANE
jgi:hypothetical protein